MIHLKKYSYLVLWAALILTVGLVWFFGQPNRSSPSVSASPAPAVSSGTSLPPETTSATPTLSSVPEATPAAENRTELNGLWIPFMSLTTADKTEAAFKENFKRIADSAKEKGINALFVHVRPFADALYSSALFPWSHILTGTQGQNPGYDPLAYMTEYTHSLGMEIHAWINPLRIKNAQSSFTLSSDNPYNRFNTDNPHYFMEYNGGIYLNPAYPYVRQLIADGVSEIVKNYEVDGIHFDDYFYPTEEGSLDSDSYAAYSSSVDEPLPLAQWRTGNINAMIAEVYQKIKVEKDSMIFGISPTGNIENNERMNADVKTWCAIPGYIDYICPQIYYSYGHPVLGYTEALTKWMTLPKHENLKTYIGLALYKAGTDADENTWLPAGNIIADQISDAKSAGADGIILYSSDYMDVPETKEEVENAVAIMQESP